MKASDLIGKWVKGPLVDKEILILPAEFIEPNVGSGIAYSALETPSDLMEMKRLQQDAALIKKYNLEAKPISKIKPLSIISVDGMGDNLERRRTRILKNSNRQSTSSTKGYLGKG